VLHLIASLAHHARAYLDLEPREVALQGIEIDERALDPEDSPRPAVRLLPGPAIDGMAIARGLALGACGIAPAGVHLYRHRKERRRHSRAPFPWRDAIAGLAAVAAVVTSMEIEGRRLATLTERVRADNPEEKDQWSKSLAELEAERGRLERYRDRWIDFADRPLSWTRVLTSLAQCVPDQIRLAKIEGESPRLTGGPSAEPRPFTLAVISPEKHQTMGAMLADPYLKVAFPRVEVTMSVVGEGASSLQYTILASGQDAVPDLSPERGSPRPRTPPP
jgi:hypothetical protein